MYTMKTVNSKNWEFWIDVGGTFTDCIARAPKNGVHHCKVLSSGVVVGQLNRGSSCSTVIDKMITGFANGFFIGYTLRIIGENGKGVEERFVTEFDSDQGLFALDNPLRSSSLNYSKFQLCSGEEAPIVCIRKIMGLHLNDAIENIRVHLGTTIGTNALLERKGTKTALAITKGFHDLFEIGNQTRQQLFKLDIEKPQNLYQEVLEIDERIDADGHILVPLHKGKILQALVKLREKTSSLAICLLNSYQNPRHETIISNLARQVGFTYVSTSTQISPTHQASQ